MITYRISNPAFAQVPVNFLQSILEGLVFTSSTGQELPIFTDIYPLVEKGTGELTSDNPLFYIGGKDFEATNTNDRKDSIAFFANRDGTTVEARTNLARFNLSLILAFRTDYFELNNRNIKAQIVALIAQRLTMLPKVSGLTVYDNKENILQPLGFAQGEFDFDASFAGARFDFTIWDNTCFSGVISNKSFC